MKRMTDSLNLKLPRELRKDVIKYARVNRLHLSEVTRAALMAYIGESQIEENKNAKPKNNYTLAV